MKLYHRTTAAIATLILANGFKDSTGTYLTLSKHTGVWLSNIPLGINEGVKGDTLLKVELSLAEDSLADYEWIEEGKPYREWLAPAALLNQHICSARVVTEELDDPRFHQDPALA